MYINIYIFIYIHRNRSNVQKSSAGTYELHMISAVYQGYLEPNGRLHWDNGSVWVVAGMADDNASDDGAASISGASDHVAGHLFKGRR